MGRGLCENQAGWERDVTLTKRNTDIIYIQRTSKVCPRYTLTLDPSSERTL
jgi:hypothetical protein